MTHMRTSIEQAREMADRAQEMADELLATAQALQSAIDNGDSFGARDTIAKMNRLEREMRALLDEMRGRLICL